MILVFSDQLIVAGIALLIAGFAKHTTLSVHQFQIVTWQAWLASNSHQVTMAVLHHYLQSHPVILYFRFIAMTVVYILLLVAIVFAGPPNLENCRVAQHFDAAVQDT